MSDNDIGRYSLSVCYRCATVQITHGSVFITVLGSQFRHVPCSRKIGQPSNKNKEIKNK